MVVTPLSGEFRSQKSAFRIAASICYSVITEINTLLIPEF